MRTLLKSAAGRAFMAAGGWRRQHAGRLVILTFHRVRSDGEAAAGRAMRNLKVTAGDFRALLAWMRERYAPVALGEWVASGKAPDRPSFAVTFDDGWADNYENAWPVLRELGIPATIFLATGAVDERTPFWWQMPGISDAEIEHLKHRRRPTIEQRLREHPELRQAHAADFLTWEQIREMGAGGLITFGPHGHRHELLDQVSREAALEDLRRCQELIERNASGSLIPVLAWPNGNARDDLGADLEALGLRAAVGTGRGAAATPAAARWNLPRNNVDRNLARHPGLWPWLLLRAR